MNRTNLINRYLNTSLDSWVTEPRSRLVQIPDMVFSTALTLGAGAPNPGPRLSRVITTGTGSMPPTDLAVVDLLCVQPGTATPFGVMHWWASRVPEVDVEPSDPGLLEAFPGLDLWRGVVRALYDSWEELESSEEFLTDIRVTYYTYASALRLQPPVNLICPTCKETLREEFNGTELQCVECGFSHPIGLHIYRKMPPMPTSKILEQFGVLGLSSGKLRQWKHRGRIRSYSDLGGENWYKPAEVLYLLGYMS